MMSETQRREKIYRRWLEIPVLCNVFTLYSFPAPEKARMPRFFCVKQRRLGFGCAVCSTYTTADRG